MDTSLIALLARGPDPAGRGPAARASDVPGAGVSGGPGEGEGGFADLFSNLGASADDAPERRAPAAMPSGEPAAAPAPTAAGDAAPGPRALAERPGLLPAPAAASLGATIPAPPEQAPAGPAEPVGPAAQTAARPADAPPSRGPVTGAVAGPAALAATPAAPTPPELAPPPGRAGSPASTPAAPGLTAQGAADADARPRLTGTPAATAGPAAQPLLPGAGAPPVAEADGAADRPAAAGTVRIETARQAPQADLAAPPRPQPRGPAGEPASKASAEPVRVPAESPPGARRPEPAPAPPPPAKAAAGVQAAKTSPPHRLAEQGDRGTPAAPPATQPTAELAGQAPQTGTDTEEPDRRRIAMEAPPIGRSRPDSAAQAAAQASAVPKMERTAAPEGSAPKPARPAPALSPEAPAAANRAAERAAERRPAPSPTVDPVAPTADPKPAAPADPAPAPPRLKGEAARGDTSRGQGETRHGQPILQTAGPAQTPAAPAATPWPASAPAGTEAARVVAPQIATALTAQTAPGRLDLQLDPPELGRIEIVLEIADQGLRATLAAERPATGDLIRRHGEMLLQQLQDAGFADIDLRFADGRGSGRGGSGPPEGGAAPGGRAAGPDVEHRTAELPAHGSDGLDLRL